MRLCVVRVPVSRFSMCVHGDADIAGSGAAGGADRRFSCLDRGFATLEDSRESESETFGDLARRGGSG